MLCPLVRPVSHVALVLVSLVGVSAAQAAGFQLIESSGSGLGNAFAGGAAVAEDASTLWSNPAGMSRIGGTQLSGGLHLNAPSIKLRNVGSTPATNQGLGGLGGDAGSLIAVPNLYLTRSIDNRMSIGLGVTSPFGQLPEYDADWIGRFQSIKTEIKTININPSLGIGFSNAIGGPKKGPEKAPGQARCGPKYASLGVCRLAAAGLEGL